MTAAAAVRADMTFCLQCTADVCIIRVHAHTYTCRANPFYTTEQRNYQVRQTCWVVPYRIRRRLGLNIKKKKKMLIFEQTFLNIYRRRNWPKIDH